MKATNIANITAAMRGAPPILQGDRSPTTPARNRYQTVAGRCIQRDGVPFVTIGKCMETSPCDADRFAELVSKLANGPEGQVCALQDENCKLIEQVAGLKRSVGVLRTALSGVAHELAHWHGWQSATNPNYGRDSEDNGWRTTQDLIELANETLQATGGDK